MFKPCINSLKAVMSLKGYEVYNEAEPYRLNIVGIRSLSITPYTFDDCIAVFYKDEYGDDTIFYFPATTDPGIYWLKNPMHVKGTAIMCEGQYIDAYKIGLHKNYKALEQVGAIDFIRDCNYDDKLDFDSQHKEKGVIKANIHRASQHGASTRVDKWSAGCQVISKTFDEFMELCEKSRQLWNNQFTYTLLNERDFIDNGYAG